MEKEAEERVKGSWGDEGREGGGGHIARTTKSTGRRCLATLLPTLSYTFTHGRRWVGCVPQSLVLPPRIALTKRVTDSAACKIAARPLPHPFVHLSRSSAGRCAAHPQIGRICILPGSSAWPPSCRPHAARTPHFPHTISHFSHAGASRRAAHPKGGSVSFVPHG